MNKVSIIILAAGKGTRMVSDQPKVLTQLNGTSLIENLLKTIKKTGYSDSVSIVVGYKGESIIEKLKDDYDFIWQLEQLGTGHAVQQCETTLKGKAKDHLILYGDVPFISAETIKGVIDLHQKEESVLTMVTLKIKDFKGSNQTYQHFGRIIRNDLGNISKIVEFRDASGEERKVTEVNPAIYCIKDEWLWENLAKLKGDNDQKEFYLTDLVDFAYQQNLKINSFVVENGFEFMGINTKEDLELAQKICKEKE